MQGIPKLITESAFRMLDVNNDGVLDVVFGFGTGLHPSNVVQFQFKATIELMESLRETMKFVF